MQIICTKSDHHHLNVTIRLFTGLMHLLLLINNVKALMVTVNSENHLLFFGGTAQNTT